MILKALVVEDEPPARRRLVRLVEESGCARVVGQAGTVRDAVRRAAETRPDVILLDIKIPGGDGFEVLRRLQEVPPVVFVTAYDDYAVRAFEKDAVDYVVKPVTSERLGAALDRVIRRIEQGRPDAGLERALQPADGMPPRIVARRRGRIVLLDPAEVTHLTADHTLVFAWKDGQSFLVPRTLQQMEDELSPHGFRRTHRSALVNLAHIASVEPLESGNFSLELGDAERTRVPLSRRRARTLRDEIGF